MTREPRKAEAGPGSGPTITAAEFALLRDLIYRSSGIHLGDGKAPLLVSRLARRLRALELRSFHAYYQYLMEGRDPDELGHMLDSITTNETQFFREARQFSFLEETVFPEWQREARRGRRERRIRAWSAACATGEEAYSLAMSVLWHFPEEDGWDVEVLGTDLSNRVLRTALAAVWSSDQARHVPHRYLKRFLRRGTRSQEGRMQAGPELRSVLRFGRLNLNQQPYPALGRFDLILCRNVLIYFSEEARSGVLRRLGKLLQPGGYLLLGHAESPGRALDELQRVGPMVYRAPGDTEVLPASPRTAPPNRKVNP